MAFSLCLSRRLITTLHEAHKVDVIDNPHGIRVSSTTPPPQRNAQYTTQHQKLSGTVAT